MTTSKSFKEEHPLGESHLAPWFVHTRCLEQKNSSCQSVIKAGIVIRNKISLCIQYFFRYSCSLLRGYWCFVMYGGLFICPRSSSLLLFYYIFSLQGNYFLAITNHILPCFRKKEVGGWTHPCQISRQGSRDLWKSRPIRYSRHWQKEVFSSSGFDRGSIPLCD